MYEYKHRILQYPGILLLPTDTTPGTSEISTPAEVALGTHFHARI